MVNSKQLNQKADKVLKEYMADNFEDLKNFHYSISLDDQYIKIKGNDELFELDSDNAIDMTNKLEKLLDAKYANIVYVNNELELCFKFNKD